MSDYQGYKFTPKKYMRWDKMLTDHKPERDKTRRVKRAKLPKVPVYTYQNIWKLRNYLAIMAIMAEYEGWHCAELTLTFSNEYKEIRRRMCIMEMVTRLRKKYPMGAWVIEEHKSGKIHAHIAIIFRNYLDWCWIVHKWNRITRSNYLYGIGLYVTRRKKPYYLIGHISKLKQKEKMEKPYQLWRTWGIRKYNWLSEYRDMLIEAPGMCTGLMSKKIKHHKTHVAIAHQLYTKWESVNGNYLFNTKHF